MHRSFENILIIYKTISTKSKITIIEYQNISKISKYVLIYLKLLKIFYQKSIISTIQYFKYGNISNYIANI